MTEDFAKHVIGYLRSKQDRKTQETQKALQDQQIINANAESVWTQVVKWMEHFVQNANTEAQEQTFRFNPNTSDKFTVVASLPDEGRRTLIASFNRQTNAISYRLHEETDSPAVMVGIVLGTHTFRPSVSGIDFRFRDERNDPVGAEAIGAASRNDPTTCGDAGLGHLWKSD